ncbi:MAG: hypothetical protein M0Z94_08400 [Dehalococcoidales bacterium]|nr:hypothetical protein [Dehalococcoidales bacterium]
MPIFQARLWEEAEDAKAAAVSRRDENRVLWADAPVHDWYRFVLSFPPHLVRQYCERFAVGPQSIVLDPFCGTGTVLVECRKLGIPSVGLEAHPMSAFASAVKVDWTPDPDGLVEHATEVASAASKMIDAGGQVLRKLPAESMELLLTDSIGDLALHKALILLDCIERLYDEQYVRHERLALARAIVKDCSNLHFGPEVGVEPSLRRRRDGPVVRAWLAGVRRMATDLRQVSGLPACSAAVLRADARCISTVLGPRCVDAVITSPPYPNEKDYTRTTRLESVLLGFVTDKGQLRQVKRDLVRSNTRGVYKRDDDDVWIAGYPQIQRIADQIESRRIELGKTSGFERLYHRVTKLYFGGIARHLAELRAVLRPGARLAYVVGDQASYLRVLIRTGHLLADIGESLGYEVLAIELFRTRAATATKRPVNEEVVLLRWPG